MGTPELVRIYVCHGGDDRYWVDAGRDFIPWLTRSVSGHWVEVIKGHTTTMPGVAIPTELRMAIESSDIALVPLTQGLLVGRSVGDAELTMVLDRGRSGYLLVLPILLGHCDWRDDSDIAYFQLANLEPLAYAMGNEAEWDHARFNILRWVLRAAERVRTARRRAVRLVVSYCERDSQWAREEPTGLVPLLKEALADDRVSISMLDPSPSSSALTDTGGIGVADIVVLVVSQDYLNSLAYADLRPLLQKRLESGDILVLPVVVRGALIERDEFLSRFQWLFAEEPLIQLRKHPKRWAHAQDAIIKTVRSRVKRARDQIVEAPGGVGEPSRGHLTFLSAKSEDYDHAAQVHRFLTGHGLRVFFSRESLPAMGNADYGRKIDEAIDEAAHMVVVTSSGEWAMSNWVHREWRLFSNEVLSGRKRGNLLTVAAGRVQIDDLPLTLRSLEVVSLTEDGLQRLLEYVKDPPEPSRDRNGTGREARTEA